MVLFPEETWQDINYLLISLGRDLCTARNPKHEECVVADLCRYYRDLRAGRK
jgi:endonuclease-3